MRKKRWQEDVKKKKHLRRTVAMALSLCLCLSLVCTGMWARAADNMTEDISVDTGDGNDAEPEVPSGEDIPGNAAEDADNNPSDTEEPDGDGDNSGEPDVPPTKNKEDDTAWASFDWSDDYSVCTATIHRSGREDESVVCVVTREGTDVTTTYTSTAEVDGTTFTDQIFLDSGTHSGNMWYRYLSSGAIDIRGYRSSDNTVVQTTFLNEGYYTMLVYDDPTADGYVYNRSDAIPFTGNGQSYNDGILSVTPNVSFSEDGDYAILTYTVTNYTDHAVRYSLGMLADVDIDDDDYASVLITDTGVNMINQHNNKNYYLACRNLAGQDSIDTLWVGEYPAHWNNVFNNQISNVTGVDSAIALSWQNRTIYAGDTTQYHLMVGIGEGTNIRPPETHYHTFGEPVFNWSRESIACAAAFTCNACGTSRNVDCTITSEGRQLVATVYFENKTYTDTMPMTVTFVDDTAGGIAEIGIHMIGSGDDLTLKCNIPLEYFVSVEMDGVLINTSNYTLASGSTLLTLASNYLDTLSVGKHKVTMNYNIKGENCSVTTEIQIQKRATDNVPSTGDISHFTLWIMLACVSIVGMIVVCKSDRLLTIVHEIKRRK